MSDRELLELAAKAAGWTWWRSKHGYWNLTSPDGAQHTACNGWTKFDQWTGEALPEPTPDDALVEVGFCPLTDDGDALRLAVQLRLGLVHGWESFEEKPLATVWISHDGQCLAEEIKGDDPYAATRRAIVRAAAEIGKEMKNAA